jgi:hypothetical protein
MSDVVTGLRQVIQDMVAPDLKAHTAKLDMLQEQVEIQQGRRIFSAICFG